MVEFPCLMVLHEKHGDRYIHLKGEVDLYKAALAVLKERYRQDWYFNPHEETFERGAPDYTMLDVAKMPKSLQPEATVRLRRYAAWKKRHDQDVQMFADIQKAVRDKDGKLAWRVLTDCDDGEYERVSLERYYEP